MVQRDVFLSRITFNDSLFSLTYYREPGSVIIFRLSEITDYKLVWSGPFSHILWP